MNQKTSQLRKLVTQVEPGDLFPIVDVSELTSPTGESKAISALNLVNYLIASGGLDALAYPWQGLQSYNGLAFNGSTVGNTDATRCYGSIASLGSAYSIFVKAFIPSDRIVSALSHSIIFGVGASTTPGDDASPNMAYIATSADGDSPNGGNNLIAYIVSGSQTPAQVSVSDFFLHNSNKAFMAGLTKTTSGTASLYVNGVLAGAISDATWSLANSKIVMGNGRAGPNTKCTVYEAQIFNRALTAEESSIMFWRGVDPTDTSLVASYTPANLNAGPTQWLDGAGTNHLILPTTGALATNPGKRFTLSFNATGSAYLGDGTARHVLPAKYVLTSCMVESPGKPLLCIGSSDVDSPYGSSGTGSWNDNRVSMVSASYGVNPLTLLALGAAHSDRTIYAFMSASAAPCTFSFDGYIRN